MNNEIIKRVESLRLTKPSLSSNFDNGFNCAIHDVLLILQQQSGKSCAQCYHNEFCCTIQVEMSCAGHKNKNITYCSEWKSKESSKC